MADCVVCIDPLGSVYRYVRFLQSSWIGILIAFPLAATSLRPVYDKTSHELAFRTPITVNSKVEPNSCYHLVYSFTPIFVPFFYSFMFICSFFLHLSLVTSDSCPTLSQIFISLPHFKSTIFNHQIFNIRPMYYEITFPTSSWELKQ
jgi:hypothetical protein